MKIPPFYISDYSIKEDGNKHLSLRGYSTFENNLHIDYERRPEGYAFFQPGQAQDPLFSIPLLDLDTELPPQARAQLSMENLQIFDKFITLRHKVYALKEKLENKNVRVSLYLLNVLNDGYYAE